MREREFQTGIANHHIYSAEIHLLYGNYAEALQCVRQQDKLIKSAMSLPQLVRFYIVANRTLSTLYPTMDKAEQQSTRQRLEEDLARMTRWADNCEANFRHLQWAMSAELAQLDGEHGKALEHYDAAIDNARLHGFLHDEASTFERAGRHLLALGKQHAAEGYLRGAHGVYNRWGALRKVNQLEMEFPLLREWGHARRNQTGNQLSTLDLASVMKASREISGEMVLDQLLQKTLAILLENAGGQWGCLIVRTAGVLIIEADTLPETPPSLAELPEHCKLRDHEGNALGLPMSVISQAFQRGTSVVLHDARREGPFVNDPYIVQLQPRSVLCVPIARERFEAAVYMENNLTDGAFTDERVELIKLLAAQAAVAIENARLYTQIQDHSRILEDKVVERTAKLEELNKELQSLADRDGLTGVANRRAGDAYLKEVWLRLRRQPQPLSLIMLDVDHFKLFNDNYGHQMGDDCLIKVTQAIQAQLQRSTDMLVRYGGEEFMLILPDTDSSGAIQVAENARSAVEALGIRHEHSTPSNRVTVSVGYATMVPSAPSGADQLIYAADAALYKAKQKGRNRIHAAESV